MTNESPDRSTIAAIRSAAFYEAANVLDAIRLAEIPHWDEPHEPRDQWESAARTLRVMAE